METDEKVIAKLFLQNSKVIFAQLFFPFLFSMDLFISFMTFFFEGVTFV